MRVWAGRLLREPLVHFLVLGGLIFAANAIRHPATIEDAHRIAIGKADMARIRALYTQQWGAPPADADLPNLVENYVRAEVLAREGTFLGLAADDPVVRNRLIQKMEFLLQDTSGIAQPTDAELAAYLAAHAADYRTPERIVFRQIYFSPSLRGDQADGDARAGLASLVKAGSDPMGDPFMLAADPEPKSRVDLAKDFGADFAAALFALPPGRWQGPVHSALGVHLVRVEQHLPSSLPPLVDIRARVHDDLMAERFQAASDAAYARLRSRYTVVVAP
ncbi:MAG TPA: peptidylprolyl isomerase [Alphaproteobacteria bacterium]|nr:peptidylprolyl isomerase [Alphaproteobacteria bacterium]